MTDRELAGCADCGMPCTVGEYHPFAACLMFKACRNSAVVRTNLAAVVEHGGRTPSSEGGGRDGERYRRWRLLAASGTMSEAVCEMMIDARTEDDIDAVIDAASQQDGK